MQPQISMATGDHVNQRLTCQDSPCGTHWGLKAKPGWHFSEVLLTGRRSQRGAPHSGDQLRWSHLKQAAVSFQRPPAAVRLPIRRVRSHLSVRAHGSTDQQLPDPHVVRHQEDDRRAAALRAGAHVRASCARQAAAERHEERGPHAQRGLGLFSHKYGQAGCSPTQPRGPDFPASLPGETAISEQTSLHTGGVFVVLSLS